MDFKVKLQKPPSRCEVCHKADCFDTKTSKCSRCGLVIVNLLDTISPKIDLSKSISLSSNDVQIERSETELKLITYWYNPKKIIKLIIMTAILALSILIFFIMAVIEVIKSGILTGLEVFFRCVFPLTIMFLAFIYNILAVWKNRTTVSVTYKELSIEHSPIPWLGNYFFLSSELVQIYTEKTDKVYKSEDGEKVEGYQLKAKLQTGENVRLIDGLRSVDIGLFLEQQIERYLGIVDQSTNGKIPK